MPQVLLLREKESCAPAANDLRKPLPLNVAKEANAILEQRRGGHPRAELLRIDGVACRACELQNEIPSLPKERLYRVQRLVMVLDRVEPGEDAKSARVP